MNGLSRHERELEKTVSAVQETEWMGTLILVGSLADGTADSMSDIDLILITSSDGFERAWAERHTLHREVLACWDDRRPGKPDIGAHKWLTQEMVLVECLIGIQAGVRLSEPFKQLAGDPHMVESIEKRPAVERGEMRASENPIERAYDELKSAIRSATSSRNEVEP